MVKLAVINLPPPHLWNQATEFATEENRCASALNPFPHNDAF